MHSDAGSVASVGSGLAPVIEPKEWAKRRKELMLRSAAAHRAADGLPPLSATYINALQSSAQRSRASTAPDEQVMRVGIHEYLKISKSWSGFII